MLLLIEPRLNMMPDLRKLPVAAQLSFRDGGYHAGGSMQERKPHFLRADGVHFFTDDLCDLSE